MVCILVCTSCLLPLGLTFSHYSNHFRNGWPNTNMQNLDRAGGVVVLQPRTPHHCPIQRAFRPTAQSGRHVYAKRAPQTPPISFPLDRASRMCRRQSGLCTLGHSTTRAWFRTPAAMPNGLPLEFQELPLALFAATWPIAAAAAGSHGCHFRRSETCSSKRLHRKWQSLSRTSTAQGAQTTCTIDGPQYLPRDIPQKP